MKNKNVEINNILNLLKNNDAFLLASHQDPDGDSVGSLIGLSRLLKNNGNKTAVYSQGNVPGKYAFLVGDNEIAKSPLRPPFQPQVAIILECPSYDRIGFVKELITPEMSIINIDHHHNNELYGKYNYVDTDACAVGEILYQIVKEGGYKITADVATPLYAAIISDTGCFKFSNTNANCLKTAG
jgi:phosphoesterase RecJ-like protein